MSDRQLVDLTGRDVVETWGATFLNCQPSGVPVLTRVSGGLGLFTVLVVLSIPCSSNSTSNSSSSSIRVMFVDVTVCMCEYKRVHYVFAEKKTEARQNNTAAPVALL